jgi:hypothetical protein
VTEPVRPEDMRTSDVERRHVQERLRRAHDVGQLDLNEFDERVRCVWAARTRGELTQVVADLPLPPAEPVHGRIFARTPGGITMHVLTLVWASVTAINLVVWGILVLTLGEFVYPWWVWVAAPSGAVLAVLYTAGIGRPPRRAK